MAPPAVIDIMQHQEEPELWDELGDYVEESSEDEPEMFLSRSRIPLLS